MQLVLLIATLWISLFFTVLYTCDLGLSLYPEQLWPQSVCEFGPVVFTSATYAPVVAFGGVCWNMSQAVRSRAAARGWVTRASDHLKKLCGQSDPDVVELRDAIDEFDLRLASLDNAQSEVEIELKEEDLMKDINSACDFCEKAREPRQDAAKLLADVADAEPDTVKSAGGSSGSHSVARLPKLELPHFGGNPLEWTAFWDQFSAMVDDMDMPDITKFVYLRSLLDGEAKATVEGLTLTGPHYKTAWDLLERRYGCKDRIIFSHIQELLTIDVPRQAKISVLWKFYNDLVAHIRSLEALGTKGNQYGVVLTPVVLSHLPPDLRLEWSCDGDTHESDLKFLLDFLQKEIERRERSQSYGAGSCGSEAISGTDKRPGQHKPTAAALHSVNNTCPVCSRPGHVASRCFKITQAPLQARRSILKECKVCFRCLTFGKDHKFRTCKAKCSKCLGPHHVVLGDGSGAGGAGSGSGAAADNGGNNGGMGGTGLKQSVVCGNAGGSTESSKGVSTGTTQGNVVFSCTSTSSKHPLLLQTAKVQVIGKNGVVMANMLFDTGSDKTYISQRLVDKVKPDWVTRETVSYCCFGSEGPSKAMLRNVYSVDLKGLEGNVHSIMATEIPSICAPLFSPSIPAAILEQLGDGVAMATVSAGEEVNVDILLGLDWYWRVMSSEMVSLMEGMMAQRSVFGWVLSGTLPPSTRMGRSCMLSHQMFCATDSIITSFWDLESVGVASDEASRRDDDSVMTQFEESVTYDGSRYQVKLPWKSNMPKLLDNEAQARQRLGRLSGKLSKDKVLCELYHDVFCDYLQEGFIEEVPQQHSGVQGPGPHTVYYMPHRPVVKESSTTTKVRPVFDASAKGPNGYSLNDCLETGPSLIPNLPGILIRFRRWAVALAADVTKVFLQIEVHPDDRDVHRFLWDAHGEVRVMRFVRLPFGNKSSPFLLNATIKHHLSRYPTSRVVEELREDLYVDDLISGCDDDYEACDFIREADIIMSGAAMNLSKWASNSEAVGSVLNLEFGDRAMVGEVHKVLGMGWSAAADSFGFHGVTIQPDLCITKRVVLSCIQRLFDPLGLLTPFTIIAKCLFQSLWRLDLGWNEAIPDVHRQQFLTWAHGLEVVKAWNVPPSYSGGPWRDVAQVQLHAFGDASQVAYGACVYLCMQLQDGSWNSTLVYSKAKVVPLKPVTLPRLELLAALLCSRLMTFVRDALQLPLDVTYTCWTDSSVVLAWIQGDPAQWKTFVANRVAEIRTLSEPCRWRHCPGIQNPADRVTRGISGAELVASEFWLRGPEFIPRGEIPSFDSSLLVSDCALVVEELRLDGPETALLSADLSSSAPVLNFKRWSKFTKVIRIMAWVLRFIHNVRSKRDGHGGELTFEEMEAAKLHLFRYVQQQEFAEELCFVSQGRTPPKGSPLHKLSPFLDEAGLLRVKGRLQFSGLPYDSQHPIILPKGRFSLLMIRHFHGMLGWMSCLWESEINTGSSVLGVCASTRSAAGGPVA